MIKKIIKKIREKMARRIAPDCGGLWKVRTKVEKYCEDIALFAGRKHEFYSKFRPYDVVEVERNGLLNEGINELWPLICGGSATAYNNANARLGVGDSSAAFNATHTDLQAATNKLFKAMETGYPTYGSAQKATFKASFSSAEANWAWNEWGLDNGVAAAKNMNRKVETLGTKTTGTWVLTVEISLS